MRTTISRRQWGARPARRRAAPLHAELAVVHHTTGPNDYRRDEVPGLLRAIQALHMDSNGWDDIGYNLVIDRFGRVCAGRAGVGAHARGHNRCSLGIALLGDFTHAPPSIPALSALTAVAGALPVLGHRDLGDTECPGRCFHNLCRGAVFCA